MTKSYEHPIPAELTKNVSAICGSRGEEWLEHLPVLIGELEEKWAIAVDAPFEKGEFNFVAGAHSELDLDSVIKIGPPYDPVEIFSEANFLRVRNGDGCVLLLEEDRERQAILMERARPGYPIDIHFQTDPFACIEPSIEVLRSILRPSPTCEVNIQFLDKWVANFRRFRESDFPQDYGERALATFEKLASQSAGIYYLHGDFHPGNIVSSDRGPFLAIDPKGLVGHVAYEISVFLNNLHWWQKGKAGVENELNNAVKKFADAFELTEHDLREAAFAGMVIGAWWSFDEMPEHYDNEVALADVWDI
jgi:streptomycin 6-kinase